jgi:hypothetical protein
VPGSPFDASADVAVNILRVGGSWLGWGDPGSGYRRVDDAAPIYYRLLVTGEAIDHTVAYRAAAAAAARAGACSR